MPQNLTRRNSSGTAGIPGRFVYSGLLVAWIAIWACTSGVSAAGSGAQLLKLALEEKDPGKRIQILDEAATDQSLTGHQLAKVYFERGMAYKQLKDCSRAVGDFNGALGLRGSRTSVLMEKADCLIALDQLEQASDCVEMVLLLETTKARPYLLKGLIYEKQGFAAKAVDEYTRALNCEPDSVAALECRAKGLVKAGRPVEALNDLNALIKLVPDNLEALTMRARMHLKLREFDQALKDYERVESGKHDDTGILKEKVHLLFQMGMPGKAAEVLAPYLARYPDDLQGLILQARAQISLGEIDRALQTINRVLRKAPRNAVAHMYNGIIHLTRNEYDLGLEHLNRAIALDRSLVDAYKFRARTLFDLGDPVRAAVDLTTASKLDPSDGEIFALRGLAMMKRLLYNAAIADFSKALECLPGDNKVLYDRAVTYSLKDDQDNAIHDLDSLLTFRPECARALSLRGIAHFLKGEQSEAGADLNRSVELGSQDPLVWNNRGFFYLKLGKYDEAGDDFKQALRLNPDYEKAQENVKAGISARETASLLQSPDKSPGD